MKKNKIIGLFVATGGVIASFAAATALYVGAASNVEFPIGKAEWHAQDGAITYKINGAASGTAEAHYLDKDGENGGTALGGKYTQISYEFALSAEYGTGLIKQDYVLGNFALSITNLNSKLYNKVEVWCDIDGYTEHVMGGADGLTDKGQSYGYANYRVIADNPTLTEATYNTSKDIAVKTDGGVGGQKARVFIKLKSDLLTDGQLVGDNLVNLAEEKVCDVAVTWGAPSSTFEIAHVVGDVTEFNEDEAYAMVPNINKANSEGFEWMFSGLTGFGKGKCRLGETWSADPDAVLDSTKSYNVYWSGSNSVQATFAENK